MADYNIGALIAGTGGITPPSFDFQSAIGNLPKAYWEGLDQAYKRRNQDLFKDGVPRDASGNFDWNAAAAQAVQSGGVPVIPAVSDILKIQNQQGIQSGLQAMGRNVFSGDNTPSPTPRPAAAPAGVPRSAVGYDEGVKAGLYDPPAKPGGLPPVQNDNMTVRRTALLGNNAVPPEIEGLLRDVGVFKPGADLRQHMKMLREAESLANSTGVRDAGKPYSETISSILKFIEQRNAPTEKQKDYELYRRQGGTASFEAWSGDKESKEARIAVDKKTAEAVAESAAQVARTMPILQDAIRLAKSAPGGMAGPASAQLGRMMSSLGMKVPERFSDAEALNSIAMHLLPLVRQPGPVSNFEQQAYLSALPSLLSSKEGRVKAAEVMLKLAQRGLSVARIYRDNLGSSDLYEKLAAADKPIFTPQEREMLESAAKATREAKAPQQAPASDLPTFSSAEEARKAGVKKFRATDGSVREFN